MASKDGTAVPAGGLAGSGYAGSGFAKKKPARLAAHRL